MTPGPDAEFPGLTAALAGQFRLERELGRGGMGVVWLARDLKLDRLTALKVLPPALAARPEVRERFVREARTAARLAHPNIVPVYRADEAAGTAFFVMAYVDGESLGDRVRDRGPLAPAEAVRVLREVAWALAYAHARGVVHRDVKPENILLERAAPGAAPGAAGRALVTDFGIAHQREGADPRLTSDGHVLGTLHYMSPEQVNGLPLDGRSDLYALGVVAFYALSGRLPFGDLAGPAVLVAHATRPAPPLAEAAPHVPAALAAVVDRCVAKDPADRFPTGEALADALERALAAAPAAARDTGPALPAGVSPVLSEAQAAALWQRAAQLQADALRRVDARRELAAPRPAADAGPPDDAGYRVAHVVSAAEEAGISRQYVAMALAELPRGGVVPAPGRGVTGLSERQASLYLGTRERSLGVSHVAPATPARTLRALGQVLPGAPYELRLRETVGAHPLDGGVLVFDLPGPIVNASGMPASTVNFFWMGLHHQLEARQVQVTLRAVPGERPGAPDRTELTMTCDLRPGVRRNVRASQWMAGIFGGGGGVLAGAVLAKGAAVVASAAVLGPAVAIGAGVGGLFVAGYRALYASAVAKARGEMLDSLAAVAAAVRAEDVFGAPPSMPRARARNPDDVAIATMYGTS